MDIDPSFTRQLIQGFTHVIRVPLTRNIGVVYPDVRDEIITAFNDRIPIKNEGKQSVFDPFIGLRGPRMD
jgi:hypothetical protein